jgi:hypothetical protein
MRLHCAVLACVGVLAVADYGIAGDVWGGFCHGVRRDWARNNYWPEPFIYPDRDAVVAPFGVMIAKGWQVQNTLSDHHFQPGTAHLTDSGVLKMQQVLMESDPHRRTIFVQTTASPEQTAARLASVRSTAAQNSHGMEPAVYPTSVHAHAWSAETIHGINVKLREAQGPIKLPAAQRMGDTK